ncbi:MAG: hypothetical protein OIF47_11070 [Marinibacterium sp.]|nr:hypothetical protein [Marinibacterium sp.]
MTQNTRQTTAALATLIVLQLIMLSALYAGIRPHPPVATPLFGIAPFLGASVAIALSAIIVEPLGTRTGRTLSSVAAIMALVSFGPQKYFDAQFGLIYPAVILGQIAALVIGLKVLNASRRGDVADQAPVSPDTCCQ